MRPSTRFRSLIRALALAGAIALLAGACGDDSESSDTTDPAPTDAPSDNSSTDNPPSDDEPTDRSGELIGSWNITAFQLAGALGEASPLDTAPASIEFGDDGTFDYSNGCNTGEGEWEARSVYQPAGDEDDGRIVGQPISFGSISQTEIGCEAELADQDLAIGGAIRAADLFTLEDGTLTLWRDGNVMIAAVPA